MHQKIRIFDDKLSANFVSLQRVNLTNNLKVAFSYKVLFAAFCTF